MKVPFTEYRSLLLTYVKPHWTKLLLLFLLLLISIICQLLSPWLLRTFIDGALAQTPLVVLLRIAALIIAVTLGAQVIAVFEAYVAGHVAWSATNALRIDLARYCLRLGMDFHHMHTPGEMIERIDGDISMLNSFFSRLIVAICANVLFLMGVVAVLWSLDWRIGGAMASYALITLLLMITLRRVGLASWEVARQASADLFGFLEERVSGTEEIRASGAIAYLLARLYPLLRRRLRTERRAVAISILVLRATMLLLTGGTILALGLGASLFKAGVLSLGTVYLFFSYTQQIAQPLRQISNHLDDVQQVAACVSRLRTLLLMRPNVVDGAGTSLSHFSEGPLAIAFQQVSFGYMDGEAVLKDISFALAPGKVLGVVGRTGSGKTTLSRLLLRLYDPQQGTIRVGDVDIRTQALVSVRQCIGLVTQDVQVFHATIRENVTMFDSSIGDSAILIALRQLGLWEWYQAFPQGLDTMLTSGGEGLSAGEAQLLALTRVFLRRPAVVVLDEATARIDPATEAIIERALDTLLHNRTGIIIAHRLSTLQRVDDLLLLEDGCICEQGTRAELLQNSASHFSRLLRTAQGEMFGSGEDNP